MFYNHGVRDTTYTNDGVIVDPSCPFFRRIKIPVLIIPNFRRPDTVGKYWCPRFYTNFGPLKRFLFARFAAGPSIIRRYSTCMAWNTCYLKISLLFCSVFVPLHPKSIGNFLYPWFCRTLFKT